MNNAQKYTFTQKYLNSNDSIEGVALQDKIATRDILANVFDSDAKNQKLAKKINYLMTNKTDWISGVFKINKKTTRGFMRK